VGVLGELAALAHYQRSGYRLVARNWRCPLGELDLVVSRGPTVVFCEVKARRGDGYGGPHEAVTRKKQAKLRALAQAFLSSSEITWEEVRFDVASVLMGSSDGPWVNLFEAAF
jgi:putative endonuclease